MPLPAPSSEAALEREESRRERRGKLGCREFPEGPASKEWGAKAISYTRKERIHYYTAQWRDLHKEYMDKEALFHYPTSPRLTDPGSTNSFWSPRAAMVEDSLCRRSGTPSDYSPAGSSTVFPGGMHLRQRYPGVSEGTRRPRQAGLWNAYTKPIIPDGRPMPPPITIEASSTQLPRTVPGGAWRTRGPKLPPSPRAPPQPSDLLVLKAPGKIVAGASTAHGEAGNTSGGKPAVEATAGGASAKAA